MEVCPEVSLLARRGLCFHALLEWEALKVMGSWERTLWKGLPSGQTEGPPPVDVSADGNSQIIKAEAPFLADIQHLHAWVEPQFLAKGHNLNTYRTQEDSLN